MSNRPDELSGDKVLVAVDVPQAVGLGDVAVKLNGSVVTAAFAPEAGTHRLVGLIGGLRLGKKALTASAKRAGISRQELVNYPITGPVFSGTQQKQFYCQTHEFRVDPDGPFLTASQIAPPCQVPTRVDDLYRTAAGAFAASNQNDPLPADLVSTTTTGVTVPYIVRLETGTITPTGLQAGCWYGPNFVSEPQFLGGVGTSACNTLYPGWTFPRFVAGSPLAHDVVQ